MGSKHRTALANSLVLNHYARVPYTKPKLQDSEKEDFFMWPNCGITNSYMKYCYSHAMTKRKYYLNFASKQN